MATIKPFAPLRYTAKSGGLDKNVCPPYDIINAEQRKALVEKSRWNLVQLELPEGDEKYKKAAKLLEEWKNEGVLAHDGEEGLFVYAEDFTVKSQSYRIYGVLCRVKLCEFSEKVILPHEETLTKAKTDRFNLMSETFCNFSPVYSLYMDDSKKADAIIKEKMNEAPIECFTDGDGVTHKLWKISDKTKIEEYINIMKDKQLFIADGHHRYETALNFKKHLEAENKKEGTSADYIMMMLVEMDNDGLVVFPTHRMVTPPEKISTKELLEKCSEMFDIEKIESGAEKAEAALKDAKVTSFVLFDGKDSYLLKLTDNSKMTEIYPNKSNAWRSLDVSILHTLILDRILKIDSANMAAGKSLVYTRSAEEAFEKAASGEAEFSFIINPTKVSEIKDVSLAGEKMPQKSTYFYPKLITGMTINDLNK